MPKPRRKTRSRSVAITPRFECKASGDKGVEMLLYGDIGEWYEVNAQAVARALAANRGKDILVRINTYGGEVWEATTIHNLLKSHDGKVTTLVDGLCASAGNHILLAGEHIKMASNAMLMTHKPITFAYGNADDFREIADILDKTNETIIATYRERTGLSYGELNELLAKDTYMTATEALEKGFVDAIAGESKAAPAKDNLPSAKAIEDRFRRSFARRMMADPVLNHVPDVPANTVPPTTEVSAMGPKVKAALFARDMIEAIDATDEACKAALNKHFNGKTPENEADILKALNAPVSRPSPEPANALDVEAIINKALSAQQQRFDAEQSRQNEVRAICNKFNAADMIDKFISDKTSVVDVKDAILNRLAANNGAVPEDSAENTAGNPQSPEAKYDAAFKAYQKEGGTQSKEAFINSLKVDAEEVALAPKAMQNS